VYINVILYIVPKEKIKEYRFRVPVSHRIETPLPMQVSGKI
jgi:hypothetical protein